MRINLTVPRDFFKIRRSALRELARIPVAVRLRDLPVYLAYCVVPLVAAICIFLGIRQPSYELMWTCCLPLLLCSRRKRLSVRGGRILTVIALLVMLKYVIPILWYPYVSVRAMLVDLKWIYYLVYAVIWMELAGNPDWRVLYRCGRNMAAGYVFFVLIRMCMLGGYSRSCAHLFSECNYVCYLMLIPYCFLRRMGGSRRDRFIFLLAVFLSDSRTGIATAAVLTAYPYYKASRRKLSFLLLVLAACVLYVSHYFVGRGASRIENVDRVIFSLQCLYCLQDMNIFDFFFGMFPGSTLPMKKVVPGFGWHIAFFEKAHGIKGCYPFYFHSTYLRMLLVWGVPLVAYALLRVIRILRTTRNVALRNLLIVFLMESISLSTLSLTNISVIFFMTLIPLLAERGCGGRSVCRKAKLCLEYRDYGR